jgi:hypothetical protein
MVSKALRLAVLLSAIATSPMLAQQSASQLANLRHWSGQGVAPVYEGFDVNPDGSFNMWFGYMNRNYEEEIDLPVGAANMFEPGGDRACDDGRFEEGVVEEEGAAVDQDHYRVRAGPAGQVQRDWLSGVDPLSDFRDALLLGRAEESDTLSGRAFIWPEVLSFVSQRPLFGYGFESFWTPERIETISTALGWGLREAHNAYLEMLLSLGVVGLILMLFVVASGVLAAVRGYRDERDPTYTLPLGMLVFGLLNAGLESGIVVVELVTFVLACCLLRMALFRERSVGCISGAQCTARPAIYAERRISLRSGTLQNAQ